MINRGSTILNPTKEIGRAVINMYHNPIKRNGTNVAIATKLISVQAVCEHGYIQQFVHISGTFPYTYPPPPTPTPTPTPTHTHTHAHWRTKQWGYILVLYWTPYTSMYKQQSVGTPLQGTIH